MKRHEGDQVPGTEQGERPIRQEDASGAQDAACRCRETANMTPRQLLDLMISDLAFWKKKPGKE